MRELGGIFATYSTASLADQCRMQAREGLDPELTQFMHAVADRLAGFDASLDDRHRTPVNWRAVVRDQRELERMAGEKSAGGRMAREAADTIELLARQRVYAIEWANRSVDGIKERMWEMEDRLSGNGTA